MRLDKNTFKILIVFDRKEQIAFISMSSDFHHFRRSSTSLLKYLLVRASYGINNYLFDSLISRMYSMLTIIISGIL